MHMRKGPPLYVGMGPSEWLMWPCLQLNVLESKISDKLLRFKTEPVCLKVDCSRTSRL